MHKDLFVGEKGGLLRKAFNKIIQVEKICKEIIGEEVIPAGVIPPGMPGHDPELKGYSYDIKWAKKLMEEAGYSLKDPRIKELSLLHTDGDKTRLIANRIRIDLSNIGVKITLKEVKYEDQETWLNALESGLYHLFLMGYKAGTVGEIYLGDKSSKLFYTQDSPKVPSEEKDRELFMSYDEAIKAGYDPAAETQEKAEVPDTLSLIRPLFHSKGDANFTFYQNDRVDTLFDQLADLDRTLTSEYNAKLKTINRIIREDVPTVNLFYITKL
jgi:ABC-type transport system substrate-binding protein